MEAALTILLDGLQFSSYLFIVSAGLTIIFGVMKILNVAHGSFYAWGAYTAAFFIGKFSDMGLPDALGFLIIVAAAIVVGVILGFIIEQGILKHMYERDEVLIVLATFGLFLVLEDIILIAFGTDPYFAYQPMALLDSVEVGGITRDVYGMTLIGVAAVVAVGCWWLLNRNKEEGFLMRGHLGQHVFVFPEQNIIIVRLGKSHDVKSEREIYPTDQQIYLEEAFKMLAIEKV